MDRRPLLGLLLALAACSSAQPSPAKPRPAPPADEPSADEAAIVWIKRDGNVVSQWVENRPEGPTVRLERGAPVIATKEGLWAVRVGGEKIKLCLSCGCDPSIPGDCTEGGEANNVSVEVVNLKTQKRASVITIESSGEGCDSQLQGFEGGATATGVVGPYLFLTAGAMESPCDAPHPMWRNEELIFDLETMTPATLAPPEKTLDSLARKAHGELVENGEGCLMDKEEVPTLYSSRFAYDRSGVLKGTHTFTMSSNYMCGTGPGHYSVATDVGDDSIPEPLGPLQTAPAWIRPYLQKNDIAGLSALPSSLDRGTSFEYFSSLPPPKKAEP